MKKTIAFALSLLMAGSLLFGGCGKTTGGKADNTTIDWLMFSNGPADEDAPVKQYFEEKFGVKFNLWYIERSKWDDLLSVRFAAGEIPDVFPSMSSSSFRKYVEQGLIMPLSMETLEKDAPKLVQLVNDYDPEQWKYSTIDGKLYAIPTYNYANKYHIASVWRDDWLKKVGIDKIPETLDEAETAFYKFRNEDPDGNGQKDTYGLSDKGVYNSIFGAFGYLPRDMGGTAAMWADKDGKLVYSAVQPEMKEALKLLNKWYTDGIIDPEFLAGENTSGHWSNSQAFVNGRIGYTANGMFYHIAPPMTADDTSSSFYRDFKKLQGENATYAVGRPPIGPEGKSGNFKGGTISSGGIVFGNQLADNPEKLKTILNIISEISTDFDLNLVSTNGFEGEHFDKKEDGTIIAKEGFKTGAELSKIGAGSIFNMSGLRPVQWYTDEHAQPISREQYKWAEEVTNFSGIDSKLLVEVESGPKYNTVLDKTRETTYIQIITGEKPIDYFDEWVEQWKKNGGEQLEKEANEWYNTVK